MILSLQGCMAVGKTTALAWLEQHVPYVHVSYENNEAVIRQVRERGLNKQVRADYLEIQKLWIDNEIRRYREAVRFPCTVMDFGAEEIEFYTLHYPRSIQQDWEVEQALQEPLRRLRACMPARILFLDASEETLRRRKEQDPARSRTFFEHHLRYLMPLKRAWFARKENVDYLPVDGLSRQEVAQAVRAWVDACLQEGARPGTAGL